MDDRKHVIVIGAGFGGLQAVKKLSGNKDIRITFIDRKNHHLFQPLLYQVATAVLNPADIAIPTRSLTYKMKNVTVLMDEVTEIDKSNKRIILNDKVLPYDYLVIATGAMTSYFGHSIWKEYTLGLKNLMDALSIRNKLLFSFEEAENHPDRADELLKYIIIGGGPTGVELAGSIAELSNSIINDDFRNIDTRKSKIILIEGGSDLLPSFDRKLSVYTKKRLEKRGVTIMLNSRVLNIEKNSVFIKAPDGERTLHGNLIIWAAGVKAVPLNADSGFDVDRQQRIKVNKYCSLNEYPDVFAIGDAADFTDENGKPLPGLSAVAMQQGRYVAKCIINDIKKKSNEPFRYLNKGNMATIGRMDAVGEVSKFRITGTLAWLLWLFVHLFYQVGFKNRVTILITWIWSYFTFGASARIIQEFAPLTKPED
ncbi:MAG TPA: NAD(P)/FAD-dependent oxidoreductase [Ignavibacteria bacterium]|nr:NAD(P)/FAD-dependent oxidoreductase [Ignavibacteria bacterium]HQY52090.1 NAD(P)/FAD-dependent oxidoreductase [Ignavibacteria bacterium]HRB00004.1 NAD(P)/FAD-dependent oxidoreductase [Ignavibacteria bacterium]